jgi:ParB family transcriptional regulator, chromosome partitioning protein
MMERKGLGRGLSALLDEDLETMADPRTVPVEHLRPSPFQPRRLFAEEELAELADSIRAHGLLQPILVRQVDGGYEIVAGERRWRAAQLAQLHEVPVVVRQLDDGAALEVALVENIQRQDLTALEEAEAYRRLINQFGHTQEALGRLVGKSRSHIANTLRLLELPEQVRTLLHEGRITAGHARAALASENPTELAAAIAETGVSVREAERMARPKPNAKPAKDADTLALERSLSEACGLKVAIEHRPDGSGEVRVAYRSLDQLDDIARRITG